MNVGMCREFCDLAILFVARHAFLAVRRYRGQRRVARFVKSRAATDRSQSPRPWRLNTPGES